MKRAMTWLALAGNSVFIVWVLYNGIDEGFRGTPAQIASWLLLTALLVLDSALIVSRRNH